MTTSPAAELHTAAQTLRDLATRATHEGRPRWTTGHTLGSRSPVVVDHPETPSVLIETYAARLEDVNRYIAAMHPGVGAALAKWLETTAVEMAAAEGTEYEYLADEPENSWTAALVLARQILGGQP